MKQVDILTKMQNEIGDVARYNDDMDTAKQFYLEAAEKEYSDAQNNLAVTYEKEDNYDKALFWYKQAANNNLPIALVNLGKMYEYGRGCNINYKKAYDCYKQAAKLGHEQGYNRMAYLYVLGKLGKENQKKAFEIWNEGFNKAKKINRYCAFNLGMSYQFGTGCVQDENKAFKYLQIAAKQDLDIALYELGQLYQYGIGTRKDLVKAIDYYLKASKQGNNDSMYKLGMLFYDNIEIERNDKVCNFWLLRSALNDNQKAKLKLGELYFTGETNHKTKNTAMKVFEDFLQTVKEKDIDDIESFISLRNKLFMDDKEFWKLLDSNYTEYCKDNNKVKLIELNKKVLPA